LLSVLARLPKFGPFYGAARRATSWLISASGTNTLLLQSCRLTMAHQSIFLFTFLVFWNQNSSLMIPLDKGIIRRMAISPSGIIFNIQMNWLTVVLLDEITKLLFPTQADINPLTTLELVDTRQTSLKNV
jgi:hypothetical protein